MRRLSVRRPGALGPGARPVGAIETDERRIRVEAGEWVVQLSDEDASDADRRDFEAWADADPRHRAAFERMQGVSTTIAEMPSFEANDEAPLSRQKAAIWSGARRWAPAAALAASLLIAVFVGVRPFSTPPGVAHETVVAEIRDVALGDGSIVTLGADSRIEVAFSDAERRVVLTAGEAFFSVEKDEARPFFVTAGETSVRVVGTKFDVRLRPEDVEVSVLEGIVEVTHDVDGKQSSLEALVQTLTVGEGVAAPQRTARLELMENSTDRAGAWRRGRLAYEDASLREVVADANRYYEPGVVILSESIADLRVTASFRAGQVEQMVDQLELGLPISANKNASGRIVLRAD